MQVKTTAASPDLLTSLYRCMLRIRMFEEKIVELYPEQEMKCPVHLCIGQEAISAGVMANLRKEDFVLSNHRGHGHCLAKGTSMRSIMAELYGRTTGCSKGKGGSMHLVDVENGIPGTTAIVGGGIPLAVGTALASKMRGNGRVSVAFFGDGAFDEGAFYESFNFASLRKLPVVFVCENNGYATNSPQSARQPSCRIADTAAAFSAHGVCVDGNDAAEVYGAAKEAVERARAGEGPGLIEAVTYRWKGHVGPEEDHLKGCRAEEELTEWKKRCPVRGLEEKLSGEGVLTAGTIEEMRGEIAREIEDSVEFALSSPLPTAADLTADVYHDGKGNGAT